MKKLLFFWNELKATFWFVPILTILLSIILSFGLVYIDRNITYNKAAWYGFFLVGNADSARTILSTISGAMIGVAGTVFSVTLVALTLASSQFGPRLIKNFMYVRLNQIVLGSYVSTYLYCLFVLNAVKDQVGNVFIPSLSIFLAILAAMANIVLLIIFIHRIAVSIQADHVISEISSYISGQVSRLFPEKLSEENPGDNKVDIEAIRSGYQHSVGIHSPRSGYLQYIDYDTLESWVTKKNAFLELEYRPGGYLVQHLEIGKLYTMEPIENGDAEKVVGHIVVGKTKTSQQDLEYSIHQMVEIAARALSPGVNDPYTAIACIDNLTSTMSYLAQAKFPSRFRYDENGTLRIKADVLDFIGVLDAAFNQIRQYSGGSTAVIIRLMESLITIFQFTKRGSYRRAVVKHARMVLNIGREFIKEENDILDLSERSKKILGEES